MMLAATYQPWAFIIAFAAAIIVLVRTYHRKDRRHLALRMILSGGASAALAALIIQPARTVNIKPESAILLTSHHQEKILDSLLSTNARYSVFTFKDTTTERIPNTIPDLNYLYRNHPEITTLHILGDGLPYPQNAVKSTYTFHFYLNDIPEGITSLNYTDQLRSGESLRVDGHYLQRSSTPHKVYLSGPSGRKLLLATDTTRLYRFTHSEKTTVAGRFIFYIEIEDAKGNLTGKHPLPVFVNPPLPLRTFILNAAPSFERNYLKNWLDGQEHPVAVRSTISRQSHLTEFLNRPATDLTTITQELLDQFDVLITDQAGLQQLSRNEIFAVRNAVQDGLGIYLLADGTIAQSRLPKPLRSFFLGFPLRPSESSFDFKTLRNTKIELQKAPYTIAGQFGIYPCWTESGNHLVACRHRGRGMVCLSMVSSTYRLLLEGNEADYARFWSETLQMTARRRSMESSFKVLYPLEVFPDYPADIQIFTSINQPSIAIGREGLSTVKCAAMQYPFNEEFWQTRFWPQTAGWHRLTVTGEERESWFYVSGGNDWTDLRRTQQIRDNQKLATESKTRKNNPDSTTTRKEPLPLWWFYLLFLTCAGGLWLEEKL